MAAHHGLHFGGNFFGFSPLDTGSRSLHGRSGCVVLDVGRYRLDGTTKIAGTPDVPTQAPVWLLRKRDHKVIRTTISDSDGVYSFEQIPFATYVVLAFDTTGTYNAVVADNLEPSL